MRRLTGRRTEHPTQTLGRGDGPGEECAPRTFGRYIVLSTIHRSATADLYAAYDPDLDRRVAIKHRASGSLSAEAKEAALLVNGGHPHLVTIHDVGMSGGRLFIAMELLTGGSLREWLAQEPRPHKEILKRFLQAGEGLAAAHAQGLVHRGFSAADVFLDAEGRARVLGLRRLVGASERAAAELRDQRDFAVALHRALDAAVDGVPARTRRILQSQPIPGSLAELVAHLRREPGASWPRWVALGGLLVLTGFIGLKPRPPRTTHCGGADAQLAKLLDRDRAQAIHRAFLRSGRPYAEDAFLGVQRTLAVYQQHVGTLYLQVCRDAEQPADVLRDLRVACLDQQRAGIDQLLAALTQADDQLVQRSVGLLQQLTDSSGLSSCKDVAGLSSPPPPADAATAARVDALRQDLARSDALRHAGQFQEALRWTTDLTTRAAALPYRPVQAEVLFHEGRLREMLDEPLGEARLLQAARIAEASRHDRLAAEIWLYLLAVTVHRLQRVEQGTEYARYAAAGIERCATCGDLWERWHGHMGSLLFLAGRWSDALVYAKEALNSRLRRSSSTGVDLANYHNNLGALYTALGQTAASQASLQQALRITESELGPWHPAVGVCLENIARNQQNQGQLLDALSNLERSRRLHEAAFGKTHSSVGLVLSSIGSLLLDLQRYQDAQARLEQSVSILGTQFGPRHTALAGPLQSLGELALRTGRPEQALQHFAAALAAFDALPAQYPDRVFPLVGMGKALVAIGRAESAMPVLARALRICGSAPESREALAGTRFALAQARWQLGRDRREAHRLAELARADYAELGAGFQRERAEVDEWLRVHRGSR